MPVRGRRNSRRYNPAVIEVNGVHLRAGGRELLHDFNWRLPDSGVYLLLGPTGSGKSLLAKLLTGRLRPQRGQVLIDGAPLYSLIGRYGAPLFLAQAEEDTRTAEPLDLSLSADLAAVGESPAVLDSVWPEIEEVLPQGRRTPTDQLSHGQLLLAQIALAVVLPVRLAVLDGHLTVLDRDYCTRASRLLALASSSADKFLLLTASRLAHGFPPTQARYLLGSGMPVTITRMSEDAAVDTAVKRVDSTDALRVYVRPGSVDSQVTTSGKHFSLLARLENGLRIRPAASLDAAVSELRSLGLDIYRVEWED